MASLRCSSSLVQCFTMFILTTEPSNTKEIRVSEVIEARIFAQVPSKKTQRNILSRNQQTSPTTTTTLNNTRSAFSDIAEISISQFGSLAHSDMGTGPVLATWKVSNAITAFVTPSSVSSFFAMADTFDFICESVIVDCRMSANESTSRRSSTRIGGGVSCNSCSLAAQKKFSGSPMGHMICGTPARSADALFRL